MNISKVGNQPLPTEIENTAVKPPSSGPPRETDGSEKSAAESGPRDSISTNSPKRPLDEPALKAVLSEKLNLGGQGSSTVPSTRMRDNFVDPMDAGGSDPGPDPGDTTTKGSGDGDVGISLEHRSRLEGDGHTKSTQGGTGTKTTPSGGGKVDLGIENDPAIHRIPKKKVS